jgi:hypothetical protein
VVVEYCWEVAHTVTPSRGYLFNQLCLCAVLKIILIFNFPIIMTGEHLSDKVGDPLMRDRHKVLTSDENYEV